MSKIGCLLVDDEPPAVALLERYVNMIDPLEIVGTCHSALKAFELLNELEVDLMFLDIRMPVLNGIDFIKTLKKPPSIILTTAYREYALDGYDLDIVDYLLKPISFDRFLKSVDRYRNRFDDPEAEVASNTVDHIFFNVNKTKHKVIFDQILYIESLKDYVRIHMLNMEKLVVKGNLGSILKKISSDKFIRIHRSYAIAFQYIKTYNQSEVELNGIKLPIGISYREEFMRTIS